MSLFSVFRTKHVNVLLCGFDGVGKTSITLSLSGLNPSVFPPKPTFGYNSPTLHFSGVKWIFWDVCGQQKFRNLWRSYYKNVQCVAFVIDATDTERFEDVKSTLIAMINDQELKNCPFLVWVNKGHVDKLNELPKNKVLVLDCDAMNGTGLKEGLKWLKKEVNPKK
ncbi:ADP-ribosylation factor, putative [Entamoeba invadens IP1]|uniref:ADP-ribosylation factor, putative n=1 Tax=Entamoeba invadens IP1 TaxID=370355 RepID=A0A0A1U113_ENTIV|nr:ADP-ribosylation factor, putative [Entamoeba invadens IP1]ELP86183.1 ADP-ribosylation factor, putative [Entamoeba invadens IP1]|eukprot:XP_004185529.1 ADP-ribosylation factor, putative [Entamoeba invadens IP1]